MQPVSPCPAAPPPRRVRPIAAAWLVLLVPFVLLAAARPARAEEERETRRSPIVRAVEKVRHAVVSIHTTHIIRRQWFGWDLGPPEEGKGVGSGMVFHPAGYVITNAHVIARASKILVDVTGSDGAIKTREARILAVDLGNDLAIIRLVGDEGETFPFLPLGTSDDLMLGETVIAIGNPFGIGLTVTTGVIGGLGRQLKLGPHESTFDDFIQIDAAVNPGNSGGPLLDVTGRWIGVNSAIFSRMIGAEGIGFAIPVDRVRTLVGRAFKRRLIAGDWLGIEFDSAPDGAARVQYVFPRGPSQLVGVQPGDLVTAVNGEPARTLYDVRWQMAFLPHGAAVHLGIHRDGHPLPAPITVHLLPIPTDALSSEHLGFVGADVGEEENLERQIAFDAGVVVRAVQPEGPAARIGLRPGDLIVGLGRYQIRHTDDLLLFLQYVRPGDVVAVRVERIVPVGEGLARRDQKTGTMLAE